METAEEYLCLMKTNRRVFSTLEMAIKEVHSYETPEVLAMPVVEGSEDYLFWLQGELRGR
jgi:periplasmic divalent cation tolerance protein